MRTRWTVAIITLVETAGLVAWIHLSGLAITVYDPFVVAGMTCLALALTAETAIVLRDGGRPNLALAAGLALVEGVAWVQWAVTIDGNYYSATGVGPAFVILTVFLTAVHSLENAHLHFETPLAPRHLTTAIVEALAGTVLWVLWTDGHLVAGAIAVAILLGIEHAARFTDHS